MHYAVLCVIFQGCEFYTERFARYGHIYKTHLFGSRTVRVIGPDNVKKVLLGEPHHVTSTWPKSVRILLGDGALSNKYGETHRVQKRILQQALDHRAIANFVPEIQKVVQECLHEWCDEKGELLGYSCCRDLAFRLAGKVIFGMDFEEAEKEKLTTVFKTVVDNMFSLPINCPGFGFHKAHECVELLFAGHHSTASSTCSLLLQLFKNPDVCEKIRSELKLNEVGEQSKNDLTYEVVNNLNYLENVIKEILRMFPPVGGGFRKAKRTFDIGDYEVPKDWTIVYSIRETHKSSSLFPDNDNFRPERWDEPEIDIPGLRFNYLPFGTGTRSCPGEKFAKLSLKVFVIELIRGCKWDIKNPNPNLTLLPAPKPIDLLPISFTRRRGFPLS
ncbi:cytochrome P450 26A1 [Patella vulgata]|uniref:cytochrome P450 26A1 n=1 Tax=Patella vulgata TaxID=6465 RepID=UPI0024A943B9|nr:cytochrome P450 26A1 [Patella vulgata]